MRYVLYRFRYPAAALLPVTQKQPLPYRLDAIENYWHFVLCRCPSLEKLSLPSATKSSIALKLSRLSSASCRWAGSRFGHASELILAFVVGCLTLAVMRKWIWESAWSFVIQSTAWRTPRDQRPPIVCYFQIHTVFPGLKGSQTNVSWLNNIEKAVCAPGFTKAPSRQTNEFLPLNLPLSWELCGWYRFDLFVTMQKLFTMASILCHFACKQKTMVETATSDYALSYVSNSVRCLPQLTK